MAFAVRNLSVLAYALGFTQWHYNGKQREGACTIADACTEEFFSKASDMMTIGDHILVSALDGGCTLYVERVVEVSRGGESRVVVSVMARTPDKSGA